MEAAEDALDARLVEYFQARYASLDDEELAELAGRRDTLADEAAAALHAVLSTRGLSVSQVPPQDHEGVAVTGLEAADLPIEKQVQLAKDLWGSGISRAGQMLWLLALGGVGGRLAKQLPSFGSDPGPAFASAVFAGGLMAAFAFGDYRFGRYCTREICANGDKPIAERRSMLRWFAVAVIPAFLLLHIVVGAALGRV